MKHIKNLAAKIDQYNNLNEQLNQAYESIGLGPAARITGSGISGDGYAIDFNLNTGEVTYREVGRSSFLESALGIAIAAVFTGPIAGAIAATGASAAAATAAASGIVNSATQLAMTGDLNVTQALSAAATGYLNPSASANVMSNPDVASLAQQAGDKAFNEITGYEMLQELTNAASNSSAVVDAIRQGVGAAATNAIFGDDAESVREIQSSVTSTADDELGIKNDDGTTTYSVFNLPSIYSKRENGDIVHTESGTVMATQGDYDVSPYGARVTFSPYVPEESESGGGDDVDISGVDDGDADADKSATTVTVDASAGSDSPVISTALPSSETTEEPGEFTNVEFYKIENGIVFLPSWGTGEYDENGVWQGDWEPRPDIGNSQVRTADGAIVTVGSLPDGTYGEHGEDIGTTQDTRTPTEQTDAVKAVDWILVNLPNYEDMTEVEINKALEDAGLEPVDINNDGTVTSKTEAVTNGDQTSTVTVSNGDGNNTLNGGNGNNTLNGANGNGANGKNGVSNQNGTGDGVEDVGGVVTSNGGGVVTSNGGGVGTVFTGGQGGGTGESSGTGSGDGTGDGDGLGGTGMLTAMAAQPFEPLTQRSIRIDAPTIQPVQVAPTDARKELDNQLARLLNDPQSQRKQSLFGGLV